MSSFAAQVAKWVHETEGAVEAVWKHAAQEVVNEAQKPRAAGGRMRVDTGFLRASLKASTAAMPPIDPSATPQAGASYDFSGSDITATIAGAELGQTIFVGWTAAYSAHREFGARGQAPDAFLRTAAQKWPEIVKATEARLGSRLGR